METTIAKTTKTKVAASPIQAWLTSDKLKNQIAQALPSICTPERFMRVLFTAMQKTPKLMQCSQPSLFNALMTCGALGIEPDGRRAHMIPYGTQCQLIIDYKGLLELVKRSGDVVSVRADKICENDEFTWENGEISHKIDFRRPRGKAYAYYARAVLKDGSVQTEVMTKDDVDAIRKRSRAANNGPWVTDYDEMAKKTVFRRLTKWLVLSPEVQENIEKADRTEFDLSGGSATLPSEADVAAASPLDAAIRAEGEVLDAPEEAVPEAEAVSADDVAAASRQFIEEERAKAREAAAGKQFSDNAKLQMQ